MSVRKSRQPKPSIPNNHNNNNPTKSSLPPPQGSIPMRPALRTRHITPPNMIHRRIQTLPATRAQQLNTIPRRRRTRPAIIPLRRRRRRPGTRKEAARLLLLLVRLVLRVIADIRERPARGRRGPAGRHAHVQRLDRVRLGLAVGAVGDVAGAVGFDDFGFGEA